MFTTCLSPEKILPLIITSCFKKKFRFVTHAQYLCSCWVKTYRTFKRVGNYHKKREIEGNNFSLKLCIQLQCVISMKIKTQDVTKCNVFLE